MLPAARQEIRAHAQAAHIAVDLAAAAQLLPANCFILSELSQGTGQATEPRHSENSLYWRGGERSRRD